MKYYHAVLILTALILGAASAGAAEITPGSYLMKDNGMEMQLDIMRLPDGKYAINGNGQSASGARCRIGDLGFFEGSALRLGACSVPFSQTADGFEFQASPACIQCQPGATIKGKYQKKTP